MPDEPRMAASPSYAMGQLQRWYTLAQASLNQRVGGKRHESYCLSK
jgi:hypothetical protein